ncbi:hypothetical protein NC653_020155 [Populus alba x Populus x berolinensis]|uniref:Uncharacterized protein n=1 Tax=Populus alba x Populus x berolinensis TaxID=444605 RepID=A0AAD6MK48_9ROSI|nr:hypothetical protein NC653_020155 [Populus alba x Populus x berolinensis]
MAFFYLILLLSPPPMLIGTNSMARVAVATRPLEYKSSRYETVKPKTNHGSKSSMVEKWRIACKKDSTLLLPLAVSRKAVRIPCQGRLLYLLVSKTLKQRRVPSTGLMAKDPAIMQTLIKQIKRETLSKITLQLQL